MELLSNKPGLTDKLDWLAQVLGARRSVDLHSFEQPALKKIDSLYQFLEKAVDRDINISNDVELFRFFLSEYNLDTPLDPQRTFREGDLVEAYDLDLVNIYSNRTVFNFCSYDLETLITNPFPLLFRREEGIEKQMLQRISDCFEHMSGAELVGVEEHEMQEHFARHSTVFAVKLKWFSPLYSKVNGRKMGFVVTSEARVKRQSNVHGIGFIRHS